MRDVSFDIHEGETFSLVGESGSGKTTTGKAIMKICHTSGGEIYFDGVQVNRKMKGHELTEFRKNVQMIFQDPTRDLVCSMSAQRWITSFRKACITSMPIRARKNARKSCSCNA